MQTKLYHYQHLLGGLRRANTPYGLAPHKPVLLLSILDRMEEGSAGQMPIDGRLFELFRNNWRLLVISQNASDITLPLHHLSDGLGWQLVGRDGSVIERKLSSQQQILKLVSHGRFGDDFAGFLQSRECRDLARMVLLDTYFPATKGSYLATKGMPAYMQEIEQAVMEGTAQPLRYARWDEGYVRDWKFRVAVLQAYNNTCCMSGLHVEPGFSLVQACHILPHAKLGPDHIANGLALCANLHLAFDRGLISLSDDFRLLTHRDLTESTSPYGIRQLQGRQILLPVRESHFPGRDYLRWHRERHGFGGRR